MQQDQIDKHLTSLKTGLLHHVEIYVSNIERSADFWGWLLESLGYKLFQSWKEGRSWRLGDTYIVFVQVTNKHLAAGYNRCHVGLNHLAFHAESRAHIDLIKEQIQQRDLPILYADQYPSKDRSKYYAVFFEDPDRIKVELISPG